MFIQKSTTTKTAPTSQLRLMSSADIDMILADATACAEGECALDDVSALLAKLLAQQSLLSSRINEIDKLVSSLEGSNGVGGAERPVDEMRETVRAIFRIFSVGVSLYNWSQNCVFSVLLCTLKYFPCCCYLLHICVSLHIIVYIWQDKASGNNYPSLTKAMGYSGETSGGGKTAYDVLPPKPMKK
jgi:hypothetical protein